MTIVRHQILNLDQLRAVISERNDLQVQTRRELASAIKRFCQIAGVEPGQVAADPMAIRCLRARASWQLAGISEEAWRNILSRVTRSFELAGIDVARRHRRSGLIPEWQSFLNALPTEDAVKRLRRFAGWCSSQAINPQAVSAETFSAFLVYLETQSIQRNVRQRWHEARCCWNKVVAIPGSAFPKMANTAPPRWASRSLADFPQALQDDIAGWLDALANPQFDDERDALRPATLRNYEGAVRRTLSRLIDAGFAPEDFPDLESLFTPDRIRRAVDQVREGRNAEEAHPTLHAMAQALLSAFRHIEVAPDHPRFVAQQAALAILRKLANKVRNRQCSMVKKNRTRLAALSTPAAGRRFRTLHLEVARRYAKIANPTVGQALDMQMAAMHMLLLHVPLRIANLSTMDLDRHTTRPAGGKPGPWRIAFEPSEMKNGRPYDALLSEEATAFLVDYLARFHPLIAKGRGATVFPSSRTGKPKSTVSLSKQYSGFLARELGLQVNPHLLRHYAGMAWLDAMPGEYQGLAKLLGHASTRTTEAFYTGAEAKTAQSRWQHLLEGMIEEDKAAMTKTRRAA
ncbi:integrase family protein [Rhodomicrobium vannielii ATCC 17100]|uniref:Integrase family protein n=1 Tax=Rhodomicrobium vannielii (strain ATCC 17100 / DSM 162 / LMG 4299 / NCIMB 10020 / ATH 3.1.1) TaxID=648757 RepID=E3I1L1_RHOVT|nr:site-specific integrase [Rhodomicrobium vannielii]ADP72386.1 integrase family protein [Rhodomicrobium vannielii ATCC 17100]